MRRTSSSRRNLPVRTSLRRIGASRARSTSWHVHDSRLNADVPATNTRHALTSHHAHQRGRQEDLPAQAHELVVAVAGHDGLHHGEHEEPEAHLHRHPEEADHLGQPERQVQEGQGMGEVQPPMNSTLSMAHISTMLAYSPIMNSRYGVEEYSTWKPATSSDSASDRSKGGRLVSARAEMKKINHHREHDHDQRPVRPSAAAQHVPVPEAPGLVLHDSGQVHGAGEQDHRQDDQADGDLVAHHLRRRSQGAQERILGVGRPAAHDHPVDAQRRHAEQVQDAHIDVGHHPARRERDHRPAAEGQDVGDQRRDDEDDLVGAGRDDRLLQHELEEVGEGLHQAERTHHVGALAHLHAGPDLAVRQQQEGEADEHADRDGQHAAHGHQAPADGGGPEVHSAASSRACDSRSEAEHSAMVTLARAMGLVR